MTQKLSAEDTRFDRALTAATRAIVMLAREPGRQKALADGLEKYGESFAAFLLVPEVKELFADALDEMYLRSYLFVCTGLEEAVEQLLIRSGWKQSLNWMQSGLGDAIFPRWDEPRLREALSERYELIPAVTGVHVFDRRPLAIKYEG